MTPQRRTSGKAAAVWAVVAAAIAPRAHAGAEDGWWLPANYATHGESMDVLFNVIFWITMIVMVGTFVAMVYFMVKYRYRADRKKAFFSHGNPKLEMVWTVIPAVILIYISLHSKKVWEEYRYGRPGQTDKPTRILVIGQQFKWNVIYAGADGKLGKYMMYPRPSDRLWPKGPDGKAFTFTYGDYDDTKGPADMPHADAVAAINSYIDQVNPLGKVFDDPDGKDDNWEAQPGRPIYIPKGKTIELQLSSKDVVHDLFLPNFRVRLDAVPGLRGVLYFDANITSKEREDDPKNRFVHQDLDQLAKLIRQPDHPENANLIIVMDDKSEPKAADAKSPGAFFDKQAKQWKYNDKAGKTIIRDRQPITLERVKALKEAGVKEVTLARPGYFDVVCGELCGSGHYEMQGQLIVVTPKEFTEMFETTPEAEEEEDQ